MRFPDLLFGLNEPFGLAEPFGLNAPFGLNEPFGLAEPLGLDTGGKTSGARKTALVR